MGDVQGITIDPNLTVNAFSSGMAAQYNYGAGAQAARAADISAKQAETNFNYGSGALEQQDARTNLLNANTATQLISNDLHLFELRQRKLQQEKVGNYDRETESLAAQQDLNRQQHAANYQSSSAGQVGLSRLSQLQAETELNKAEVGAKTVENQLGNMELNQQMDYSILQINNAAVARERDSVLNRQRITQQLYKAHQADLTNRDKTGIDTAENQIGLLDSLSKSDYQAFLDSADVVAPIISKLDQTPGLAPALRSSLADVSKAATYVTSGTAIKNTMSGLAQARSQGAISDTGSGILTRAASVGIDPTNPSDVLNMTIEKQDGLYTFVNGEERSTPVTQAEFDSSPEMQSLYVSSERRKRSLDNPLTRGDRSQKELEGIASAVLIPEVGQGFTKLIQSLGPEISDVKGFTTRATGTIKRFQQNLQSSNPFFGPEAAELFQGTNLGDNILSRGINSIQGFLGFEDNDRKVLKEKFKDNPELADQIANSYKFRETSGMDPAIFNSSVDEMVAQTTASDSRYKVTATNSPAAVAALTKNLRSKVQRNFRIPTNEIVLKKAYELVSEVRPDLAGYDTTFKTLKKGQVGLLDSIRALVTGADQTSLNRYDEVPTK